MAYFKELFSLFTVLVVVSANHYRPPSQPYHQPPTSHYQQPQSQYRQPYHPPQTHYQPPYSPSYYQPKNYKKEVKLHKLCSWNYVEYDPYYANNLDEDDSWNSCKVDAGRAFIRDNNLPDNFAIDDNTGRVFVCMKRDKLGVYSTMNYFNIQDIGKDEKCPPLRPYPPYYNHTLQTECCSKTGLVNVELFGLDTCNRLWAVDKNGLELNDKNWAFGAPSLNIFDLKTDYLLRKEKLTTDVYSDYQFGLSCVVVNADPRDCDNAYAYLLDDYYGRVTVYSYKTRKFWTFKSPQFSYDAKYSKFHVKTRKGQDVVYYKENYVHDCTTDLKNQELLFHGYPSLDDFTVSFEQLHDEELARCSPDGLNVKFLGQKNKYGQTRVHTMNKETQVVFGIQEQNYALTCYNRENPLNPDAVQVVVADHYKLPYLRDVERTSYDLSPYEDYNNGYRRAYRSHYYHKYGKNYVVVLSNNRKSIELNGLDDYEENFGFYFLSQDEVTEAFPQCLPQYNSYKQPYRQESYKQPAPYHPPTSYKEPEHYRQSSYRR